MQALSFNQLKEVFTDLINKIKIELNKKVDKTTENNFTGKNTFVNYSPKVNRVFTRKHINSSVTSNDIISKYDIHMYFAAVNEKYTGDNNKQITHVLLPIYNAQVGDVVSIDYFAFNNNGQVIHRSNGSRDYTVIDEEIAGCKCAKIDVNLNSGTNGIGFGFMVFTHSIGGRELGAACVRNTSGNNAWTSTYKPTLNQNLSHNTNITFPYKICYETTSEVVTRFELENVTQIYPRLVGEYRSLAYEAGDVLEEDGHTWLKANGQAITKAEYPDLYDKMNTTERVTRETIIEGDIDENTEIILPNIENQVGYYYICAK